MTTIDPSQDFTYDPSTPLGLVRFFCADATPTPSFTWTDSELKAALAYVGGEPVLAACYAMRALASDRARLAVVTQKGTRSNDETELRTALIEASDALEKSAIIPMVVDAPDAAFTMRDSPDGTFGSMDRW